MTKLKPFFILFLAVVMALSFSFGFKASAVKLIDTDTQIQNQNRNQNQNQNQGEEEQEQEREREEEQKGVERVDNPEPSEIASEDETDEELSSRSRGQINAEIHRSVVANFVQNLLKVASQSETGIGEQVRVIAREQNMTREKVAGALERVQNRSRIRTFLFGTDYKNLGELRSEMVQTRNRIEQLTRIMNRLENEGDKTQIQEQIQNLKQERTRIENFIKAQEGKFSLFGWLVKLFVK